MKEQIFTVYMLHTSADTLYIGQTNNLEKRLEQHRSRGRTSAKYMRYFSSFSVVHTEQFPSRSEAMKREAQLKKLTREQKNALIANSKTL